MECTTVTSTKAVSRGIHLMPLLFKFTIHNAMAEEKKGCSPLSCFRVSRRYLRVVEPRHPWCGLTFSGRSWSTSVILNKCGFTPSDILAFFRAVGSGGGLSRERAVSWESLKFFSARISSLPHTHIPPPPPSLQPTQQIREIQLSFFRKEFEF